METKSIGKREHVYVNIPIDDDGRHQRGEQQPFDDFKASYLSYHRTMTPR